MPREETLVRVAMGGKRRDALRNAATTIARVLAAGGSRFQAVRAAIDAGIDWQSISTCLARLETAGLVDERRVKPRMFGSRRRDETAEWPRFASDWPVLAFSASGMVKTTQETRKRH